MAEIHSTSPVLSIIMPVYNEAEYLPLALESVLMQQTDFPFEVLVVDDCSTDDTAEVVRHYRSRAPHIFRYLRNPQNLGNAYAFWHGLSEAKGDFFHVLDGDDFFLLPDKLQRQVDFLREHPSYSAVATNSLRFFPDGRFHTEAEAGGGDRDYSYHQVLRCDFYLHTSAYMYRNVFKDAVPDFLQEEWARGDSIRTILVAKHGPVRYLDCIASVYRFHNAGIWSSMDEAERQRRVTRVFTLIRDRLLESEEEKKLFNTVIRNSADLSKRSRIGTMLALCRSPRRLLSKLRQPGLLRRCRRVLTGVPATMSISDLLEALANPHPFLKGRAWYHNLPRHELCMAMGMLHLAHAGYGGSIDAPFAEHVAVLFGSNTADHATPLRLKAEGWKIIALPDAATPSHDKPSARMEYLLNRLQELRPQHLFVSPAEKHDPGFIAAAQPCLAADSCTSLKTGENATIVTDRSTESA